MCSIMIKNENIFPIFSSETFCFNMCFEMQMLDHSLTDGVLVITSCLNKLWH